MPNKLNITLELLVPSILSSLASVSPIGFGLYGDLVDNTPTLLPFSRGGFTFAFVNVLLFLWNTKITLKYINFLNKNMNWIWIDLNIFIISLLNIYNSIEHKFYNLYKVLYRSWIVKSGSNAQFYNYQTSQTQTW